MNNKLVTILLVTLVTLVGFFLRFLSFTNNPNSLNIDEVSYGYSAYSILKTGKDENGVFMPLTFRSTGDYKNPLLIYSLVPSIALFGFNEFSVRLTTVLFATFSIPLFFLLVHSLSKSLRIALIGATLLSISGWHIFYSRFASESQVGVFFLILGMWFFQKMLDSWKIWTFLAGISLSLSMYAYHSERLFIPVFIFLFLAISYKKFRKNLPNTINFLLICVILVLPLTYLILFNSINTRAGMIFLTQDIDYTRYVIIDHLVKSNENILAFFFWIERYLNYFQPDFLFFNGLNMTYTGTIGLGVLYLFELPWLILGIIFLIKDRLHNKEFLILWILVGLLPASLTNNEQSAVRSLIILPPLIVIVAIGAEKFIFFISKIRNQTLKILVSSLYFFLIAVVLLQAFLIFTVHFPLQKGEAFMEGTKQSVLYALENKEKYQ